MWRSWWSTHEWHRAGARGCVCSVVSGLCSAACTPWKLDKHRQLVVTEKPAGSSCLGVAPTVQKQVLALMSFLFDSRNNAHSLLLRRKSYNNLDDKNGVTLSMDGLPADWRPVWWCTTRGSQHLQGCQISYALLPFFVVLAQINSILKLTYRALSAFLTGIIWHQQPLMYNIVSLFI